MALTERNYFKVNNKILPGVYLVLSWLIVGFGQPAWSSVLGIVSSFGGFALFWRGLFNFPSKKQRFFLSTFWFMAVEAVHLSWMTATEYQGFYIFGVYLFVLAAMGIQFGLVNLFMQPADKLLWHRMGFVASLWVVMEWARLFFICGFPFNPTGLALSSSLAGMQGASLMGVYGLSFWVILTNLFFYKYLDAPRSVKWALLFLICGFLPYIYGFIHLEKHRQALSQDSSRSIKALLIQTALNPKEKTGFQGFHNMIPPIDQWGAIFESLSDKQNLSPDLIVLPERTVPLSHNTKYYARQDVESLVKYYFGLKGLEAMPDTENEYVDNVYLSQTLSNFFKSDVIVGLEHVQKETAHEFLGNASAFYFSPNQPYQIYHKRVLLPLVEYLPFEWCKTLARKYNIYGWYEPGRVPVVFEGKLKVSPSICMEEMYSFVIHQNKKKGAQVFVNITNDVWYPNSKLPKQHFDHGVLRAVENGVPVLRACNTGLTGAVDALGQTAGIFKNKNGHFQWQKGAFYVEVPKYFFNTVYSRFGDGLILSTCLLLSLIHLITVNREGRLAVRSQKAS